MAKKSPEAYPRQYRIVRTSDYKSIYSTGQRVHSDSFVLFGRKNNLAHSRLGITVSRRIGGAVLRNRLKRLFREIFRKSPDIIPDHLDLVVNVKRGCDSGSYGSIREEFLSAVQKFSG